MFRQLHQPIRAMDVLGRYNMALVSNDTLILICFVCFYDRLEVLWVSILSVWANRNFVIKHKYLDKQPQWHSFLLTNH